MKNTLIILALVSGATLFQFCSSSRAAGATGKDTAADVVSYKHDVAPILEGRCTPCHFPDGGEVTFLDTRRAVINKIDHIIERLETHVDSAGFMPAGEKEPLSDSLIMVLKTWRERGLAK